MTWATTRENEPPAEVAGVVVIAASAGGVEALRRLIHQLDLVQPVSVVIVQHRSRALPWRLVEVLQRTTRLKTVFATEGARLEPRTIYVAPPDRHVTIAPDRTFRLVDGYRIHGLLSSANPLFTSAASVFGARVLAIVLTGGDSDGTEGALCVAGAGGVVVAQDPRTAAMPWMPASAIASGAVGRVLPLEAIAPFIGEATAQWH